MLKQLASSLTNPEEKLGQEFWNKVKAETQKKLGTKEVPMSTFNKVWIVPQKAEVLESQGIVLVGEKRLKLMMADDYLAMNMSSPKDLIGDPQSKNEGSQISSEVFRTTILPTIEKEINEGKNFAEVRQIYNSVILAAWYKKALKESLLGKVYADKGKVAGIETGDKEMKQRIYEQYLAAFKKGAYNVIKEEQDTAGDFIPRKYFSGGIEMFGSTGNILEDKMVAASALEDGIDQASSALIVTLVGEEPEPAKSASLRTAARAEAVNADSASSALVGSKEFRAALDIQVDNLIVRLTGAADVDAIKYYPPEIKIFISKLIIDLLSGENRWGGIDEDFYRAEYEEQVRSTTEGLKGTSVEKTNADIIAVSRATMEYWRRFSTDGSYMILRHNFSHIMQNLLRSIFVDHIFDLDPNRGPLFPPLDSYSALRANYESKIKALGLSLELILSKKAMDENRMYMLKANPAFIEALSEAISSMRRMNTQLKIRKWILNLEVRRLALTILDSENPQLTPESFDNLAQTVADVLEMQPVENTNMEQLKNLIALSASDAPDLRERVTAALSRLEQVLPYSQGEFLQSDWVVFWHSVMVRLETVRQETETPNIPLNLMAIDFAEGILMNSGYELNAVGIELDQFVKKYEREFGKIAKYDSLVAAMGGEEFPRLGESLVKIFQSIYAVRSESLEETKADFVEFVGLIVGHLRAPFSSVDETIDEQVGIVLRKLNKPNLQYGRLIISDLLKGISTVEAQISVAFFANTGHFSDVTPSTLTANLHELGIDLLKGEYSYTLTSELKQALISALSIVQMAKETKGYAAGERRNGFTWTDEALINVDLTRQAKEMIRRNDREFSIIDSEGFVSINPESPINELFFAMSTAQVSLSNISVVVASWQGDLYYFDQWSRQPVKANLPQAVSKQKFRAIGKESGEPNADYYRRLKAESVSNGLETNVVGVIDNNLMIFQDGKDLVVGSSSVDIKNESLETPANRNTGGIDFDPTQMNLQIKRDGKGVPLPLPQQNLEQINIEGLFPVIINIVPVNAQTLPIFLGRASQEPAREAELTAN